MKQYMLSVHHTEGDAEPTEEEMQAAFRDVDAFNERLQSEGSWVFACGLEGPSTATVVDGTGSQMVTTDGPFAEAKEHLGGFWVVKTADLDAALALAAAGSKACQAPVEVRPLQGEEG
jgi:hypothetical protein